MLTNCVAQGQRHRHCRAGLQLRRCALCHQGERVFIGPCDSGPNVVVYPEGVLYCGVTNEDVPVIFDEHLIGGIPVARLRPPAGVWD